MSGRSGLRSGENYHRFTGKKNAIEYEFKKHNIAYEREKKYEVLYKDVILPHHFYADFVVFDQIILEVKAQKGIVENHVSWVINFLAVSQCSLGLIVNFGENSLVTKRLIF